MAPQQRSTSSPTFIPVKSEWDVFAHISLIIGFFSTILAFITTAAENLYAKVCQCFDYSTTIRRHEAALNECILAYESWLNFWGNRVAKYELLFGVEGTKQIQRCKSLIQTYKEQLRSPDSGEIVESSWRGIYRIFGPLQISERRLGHFKDEIERLEKISLVYFVWEEDSKAHVGRPPELVERVRDRITSRLCEVNVDGVVTVDDVQNGFLDPVAGQIVEDMRGLDG
ncbi:hypothetical protein BT63DRAFT_458251 [Microthyrium microscopicum]|uniref:Uncharacterized protein n=1 Tax=Microthyrium microscopicum TaxID=703497 RepID=A0A6A6U390_9PEZI|nr:hypothetical protein BT63DRAFT_458251 [Microthyrium microscopicum]